MFLNLLWFAFFQAFIPINDEVNVTSVSVTSTSDCDNDNVIDLEFFSREGVVRLYIVDILFTKLSYSVVSSATGTSTFYSVPVTKVVALSETATHTYMHALSPSFPPFDLHPLFLPATALMHSSLGKKGEIYVRRNGGKDRGREGGRQRGRVR